MSKGNLLSIFSFLIGSEYFVPDWYCCLGIGIFLTLPFLYTANYFAYEDAIQQIEYDEIIEIGSKNEL